MAYATAESSDIGPTGHGMRTLKDIGKRCGIGIEPPMVLTGPRTEKLVNKGIVELYNRAILSCWHVLIHPIPHDTSDLTMPAGSVAQGTPQMISRSASNLDEVDSAIKPEHDTSHIEGTSKGEDQDGAVAISEAENKRLRRKIHARCVLVPCPLFRPEN